VHPERLTLDFAIAAAERGAEVCTYLEAVALRTERGRVRGVEAVDLETGRTVPLEAALVLEAAGPWSGRLHPLPGPPAEHALAVNVVLSGPPLRTAVGVRSRREDPADPGGSRRYLFLAPWEGRALLGTGYRRIRGGPGDVQAGPSDWTELLEDAAGALPGVPLAADDVLHVHWGLLPVEGGRLAERPRVVDHAAHGGPDGLFTVVAVKYTTARAVAEAVASRLARRLGRAAAAAPGSGTLGHEAAPPEPASGTEQRLRSLRGARWRRAVASGSDAPGWDEPVAPGTGVLRCEVRDSVRWEMATHLDDVVLRRTDLGTGGRPGRDALSAVAGLTADELGWDRVRTDAEIARVDAAYRALGGRGRSG
jgi:glycerol-3-phosphate dehydrogenase